MAYNTLKKLIDYYSGIIFELLGFTFIFFDTVFSLSLCYFRL